MLIRLVIQTIHISWNRNIKRKIIIFNRTKLWFYVQIKYLIKDHCTDQAQKAKTVLSAVSLIFVISIDLFYLLMFCYGIFSTARKNTTCTNSTTLLTDVLTLLQSGTNN